MQQHIYYFIFIVRLGKYLSGEEKPQIASSIYLFFSSLVFFSWVDFRDHAETDSDCSRARS